MTNPQGNLKSDICQLLTFLDEKPSQSRHHATSIVAILGEDLGVALFREYLREGDLGSIATVDKPVTTGSQRGPRLDRWLDVRWSNGDQTLFQCEIKNWSAHAIGGKRLSARANQTEQSDFARARWRDEWDEDQGCFKKSQVQKALTKMRPPKGYEGVHIEPLVIYWVVIHPEGFSQPCFRHPAKKGDFKRVTVFSMSAYLRNVLKEGTGRLTLNMPQAAARIDWLNRLVQPADP